MIIQLRGTSGSGKTYAMRSIMDGLGVWNPQFTKGRKKPLYYLNNRVAVLGHYESTCGGCDNIGSARSVYELVRSIEELHPGFTILCEGLLLSEDVKWTSQMKDVHCLFLVTPVETCIQQIKARRLAAGNEKLLDESNTRNRVKVIERARGKLVNLGVSCRRVSAAQAIDVVLDLLRRRS